MNLGVADVKLQVVSVSSGVSLTDAELGAEGFKGFGFRGFGRRRSVSVRHFLGIGFGSKHGFC